MHPKDADGMANSVDPDQTASEEFVWYFLIYFAGQSHLPCTYTLTTKVLLIKLWMLARAEVVV